jgi:hypothetical protein
MAAREERAVWVEPGTTEDRRDGVLAAALDLGPPSIPSPTSLLVTVPPPVGPSSVTSSSHSIGHRYRPTHASGLLGSRAVQVSLVLFSIVMLLASSLAGNIGYNPARSSSFGADNTSPSGANVSIFHPYVVSPSYYPVSSAMSLGATGDLSHPAMTSSVFNNIPSFATVYSSNTSKTQYQLEFQTGNYSATTAELTVNGNASAVPPLWWAPSVQIASFSGPITADSVVAAALGTPVVVAASSGGSSDLYTSWNSGSSWSVSQTMSGSDESVAMAPSTATALLTAIQGDGIATTTRSLGTGGYLSNPTISGSFTADATTFAPNSGEGTEGIVAATTSGSVQFFSSTNLGATFESHTLGSFSSTSTSTILNSIGGTELTSPGESAGQVTSVVDGNEVLVAYTTSVDGQIVLMTDVSPDGGTTWNLPQMTQLPVGSIIDPEATASPAGYVYVTALDNAIGSWEVDQMVFGADGRLLAPAAPLPGSGGGGAPTPSAPTVAVDAFQRPFYVWAAQPTSGNTLVQGTGAFLSPAHALQVEQTAYNALVPLDLKPSPTHEKFPIPGTDGSPSNPGFIPEGGSLTRQQTNFSSNITAVTSAIPTTTKSSCTTGLATLQTDMASEIYSPSTPDPLTLGTETGNTICGNVVTAEAPTSPLAADTGPMSAATVMGVLSDWALQSVAIPPAYSSDPLSLRLPDPVEIFSHSYAIGSGTTVVAPAIDAPDGSALYVFVGYAATSISGEPPTSLTDNSANSYTLKMTKNGTDHDERLYESNGVRGGAALSVTATFPSTNGGSVDVVDLIGAATQSLDVMASNSGSGETVSVSLTTHSSDLMLLSVDGKGTAYPMTPNPGETTVDSWGATAGPGTDGLGFATISEPQPAAGAITLGATIPAGPSWAAIAVGISPQTAPLPPLSIASSSSAIGAGWTVNVTLPVSPSGSAIYVFTGFINDVESDGGWVAKVADTQGDKFYMAASEADNVSRTQNLWISNDSAGSTNGTVVSVTFAGSQKMGGSVAAIDVVGQTASSLDSVAANCGAYYGWVGCTSASPNVHLKTHHAGDLILIGLAGQEALNPALAANGETELSEGDATTGPQTAGMGFGAFEAPSGEPNTTYLKFTVNNQNLNWTAIAAAVIPASPGTVLGPDNGFDPNTGSLLPNPVPALPQNSAWVPSDVGQTATADLTPEVLSPTTAVVYDSVSFPKNVSVPVNQSIECGVINGIDVYIAYTYYYKTIGFHWSVAADGGSQPFSSTVTTGNPWNLPTAVYLTNLTPNDEITWSTGDFQATYNWSEVYGNGCTGAHWTHYLGDPVYSISGYAGTLNTSLAIQPDKPFIAVSGGFYPSWQQNISIQWNNTMPAEAVASLTGIQNQRSAAWATADQFAFDNLPTNYTYTASLSTESQAGDWNSTQAPSANANEVLSSSGLSDTYSCTFQLVPNFVKTWGLQARENNSTNVENISWFSNTPGPSWATYEEGGTGVPYQLSASEETNYSATPTEYEYYVDLTGLSPFAIYTVTSVTTGTAAGCLTYEGSNSTAFSTTDGFVLSHSDQPYDSITGEGGGEIVTFQVPSGTTPSEFVAGYLTYTNVSTEQSVLLPITSLGQFQSFGGTYVVNLTLSPPNTKFSVQLTLNYSIQYKSPVDGHVYSWQPSVSSQPLNFTYLKGTSGDGLSDVEKVNGWTVTLTSATGTTINEVVSANPNDFATNGLVSDYIEKEFDLNPNLVDTAGSHMLDTWNLTFNLTQGNGKVPSGFEVWNESKTYNPFNTTVQYSPGHYESGSPPVGYAHLANITPTSGHGITSGDGSPLAATYLWNYSQLDILSTLGHVSNISWLRAVQGTWHGVSTLTVWGKLSWGADPLTASTPEDGIADGARLNPTSPVGLSASVSNLYVKGLTNGQGYAARIQLYAGPNATGTPELTSFTDPVNTGLSGGTYRLTGYETVLPVNQTSQFETVQFEVLVNVSGSPTLTAVPFDRALTQVDATYDMVNGALLSESWTNTTATPYNGTLDLSLSSVPLDGKVPTYLWIPTQGGTTNGLPAGLERYTGEQAFDLVVVNASATFNSVSIPNPAGGSYTLKVQPGLNNILIPREQFLNSSFAVAILEGKNFTYPSARPTPPILVNDSAARTLLTQSFGSSLGLMFDLQAYWQNRSIATGTHGNFTSTEAGVSGSSSFQVQTAVVQTTPGNNSGGLASDPSIYSNVPAPPALQSILTLSITSTATLDLLLSALLTNSTSGVNGTFQSVTGQAASLGFDAPVLSALANAVIVSQGVYGPPPYQPHSTSSGWSLAGVWNAVSAVASNPLGTLASFVGGVYNGAEAALTYFTNLAQAAVSFGGHLLARAAATLVHVGDIILSALNALLDYILSLVKSALAAVVGPIVSGVNSYSAAVVAATAAAYNDSRVTAADAIRFGNALSGSAFELGLGVGIIATVVLTILMPFDVGPALLVGMILGLFTTAVAGALAPDIGGVTAFSTSAIYAVEGWVNDTTANASVKNTRQWGTAAGLVGLVGGLADSPVALGMLYTELFPPDEVQGNPFTAIVVLALDAAVIGLGLYLLVHNNVTTAVVALAFAFMALMATGYHFLTSKVVNEVPSLRFLGLIDLGISGAALAAIGADLLILSI